MEINLDANIGRVSGDIGNFAKYTPPAFYKETAIDGDISDLPGVPVARPFYVNPETGEVVFTDGDAS
jgi:hypothetical protein